MGIVQIVVLSVIVLILLVIFVCFCVEEVQRSRMKARARYDDGVAAATRISEKACELERQIYAEAMRHRNKPKSIRDKP
jgi:uncharacterized membrane protein